MVLFLTTFTSFLVSILIGITKHLNFLSDTLMRLSSLCLPCSCWTFKYKKKSSREFNGSSSSTNSTYNLLETDSLSTSFINNIQRNECILNQGNASHSQYRIVDELSNVNKDKIESTCKDIQQSIHLFKNSKNEIKQLKNIIKIESKALASLYYDLEAERNASAIATKETMAMITRLQEEKAAIQLEAQQYKRMAKERIFYDKKIINKLTEIITKYEKNHDGLQNSYNCRFLSSSNELNLEYFYSSIKNKEYIEELLNNFKKMDPK